MDWGLIVARFGEIGIKAPSTRLRFERRLVANIEDQLLARRVEAQVAREWGRLYVTARDVPGAVAAVVHTFGIVSASPAESCEPTMEAMKGLVAAAARRVLAPGRSFAVRVRRAGEHPFTSMEVGKETGAAAFRAVPGVRVDLGRPDVEIHVEVRPKVAHVFTDTTDGPGGLPIGTQGRVVAHVARPRDALAAWLALRRGCTVSVVLAAEADAATRAAAEALRAWAPRIRMEESSAPRSDALAAAARRTRATAAVTGDLLGEVPAIADDAPLPVLRPLTGFAAEARTALARRAELPSEAAVGGS